MILAVSQLSLMAVFVKIIGPNFHSSQIAFLRNLIAIIFIFPLLLRAGGIGLLKTRRIKLHFFRAFAGVCGNILFFYSFQRLPLADVIVISQAVPIFVTILAVWVLNEKVGWRRWLAVLVGFLGVTLAIQPSINFALVSLYALAATVFWATTILMMRLLGATESPFSVAFYFMLFGAVITGCAQPWVWRSPEPDIIFLIIGVGLTGALGQLLMSYSLKLASASVVTPFNYTGIFWAIGFDIIFWGLVPSWYIIFGAILITGSGIFIFRREAPSLDKA